MVARGRRAGRRRPARDSVAARNHVHGADLRPAGAAADDRLRVDAVFPKRGARRAAPHVRSRAGAGDRRSPRAAAVARWHPRRLGGLLRHEPRSQRDHRRGPARLTLSVRDRLLRPRLPPGPGDRRAAARSRARAPHVRRHRAACRRALRRPPAGGGVQLRMTVRLRSHGPAPSNVDLAAEALRDAIGDGRIQPGERIKEIPLSQALGISRGPIRDALRLLERDGLVELIPNRGAVVPEVRALDVLEVYALRASLGSLALQKLMVEDRVPDAALDRALRALQAAVAEGDQRRAGDADLAYQSAIIAASGLPRVT